MMAKFSDQFVDGRFVGDPEPMELDDEEFDEDEFEDDDEESLQSLVNQARSVLREAEALADGDDGMIVMPAGRQLARNQHEDMLIVPEPDYHKWANLPPMNASEVPGFDRPEWPEN